MDFLRGIKKRVGDGVEECDLFSCNISLRYNNDNDYKTLTGGFISICLLFLFALVFYNKFLDTINMSEINKSINVAE